MKLHPAEKQYARALRDRYGGEWRDILSSPQFHHYSETYRARAWDRFSTVKPVNDGTLAKVFPPHESNPPQLMRDRMCAKCGLVFFATNSHFSSECSE